MRGVFGLIGLVVVLAIVGITVKKQLASTGQVAPQAASPVLQTTPGATAADQSRQVQRQYKQAVESAMQPRPDPDSK